MSRKPETVSRLKTIEDVDVNGKKVLVRLDLDVPLTKVKDQRFEVKVSDETRLQSSLQTIQYLVDRRAKITIIGHLGRPNGKRVEELSLKPVADWFEDKFPGAGIKVEDNLRFDPGEESVSPTFAQNIVRRLLPDVYIFDAFASYRPHTSVVLVPKLVSEVAIGFRFAAEISHLSKILVNPKKPVIFILGGAKADTKITLISKLAEQADEVLIGGLLPTKMGSVCLPDGGCITAAKLTDNGLDITEESAKAFADKIMRAGTVVWNGPVGLCEPMMNALTHQRINELNLRETSAYGTYLVAKAMNQTKAFTVVGGGDTEATLTAFGLESGIDWISSGGGAMLHYLANGTLPFLEAIK